MNARGYTEGARGLGLRVALCLVCIGASGSDWQHGISFVAPLEYPKNFQHFDYVDPGAPKGGTMRLGRAGTWDSFNNIVGKGRPAAGIDLTGANNLLYDRLLEPSADEDASQYGRLAESVSVAPDRSWVAFRLREGAAWHDRAPITPADVIFTFNAMKAHGSPAVKSNLKDVVRVEQTDARTVRYVMRKGVRPHGSIPIMLGQLAILPAHYWRDRDISRTTVEPPLGSGPYKVGSYIVGRRVTYERVDDYWGRDLPVNRGRYNFDRVVFDYYRDEAVQREALKSGDLDVRYETVAKAWLTEFPQLPAVEEGYLKRELMELSRTEGTWWAIFFNLRRARFQDIRVREALVSMYDWAWINRVLTFGFYRQARSLFNNSPMAHTGLPSPAELRLLEPFRESLPKRVFTKAYVPPISSGYGYDRERLLRSIALFREAGWEIRDGTMTNVETGEPFVIEAVLVSPALVRTLLPYANLLKKIGIETSVRALEVSNWLYRMRARDFDLAQISIVPTNTPGYELLSLFGSAAADADFGRNWIGIKDPAVDALLDAVVEADTEPALLAATRALDRVLLWNFYLNPRQYNPGHRILYWNRFGRPEHAPLKRLAYLDTWWLDEEKDAALHAWRATME